MVAIVLGEKTSSTQPGTTPNFPLYMELFPSSQYIKRTEDWGNDELMRGREPFYFILIVHFLTTHSDFTYNCIPLFVPFPKVKSINLSCPTSRYTTMWVLTQWCITFAIPCNCRVNSCSTTGSCLAHNSQPWL